MTVEIATIVTSGIIGTSGVIIAAIIKRPKNCNEIKYCDQHSGVIANFESMQRDLTEIKADVKSLLGER